MTGTTQANRTARPAAPAAHILIVDDEHTMRRTLSHLFKRMSYRTSEAASGRQALETLAHQDIDLVLLDLKMPGMDGTEVLKAARSLAPDTIFIILTAYGTLESAILGIRYGAFDYLLKPSPMQEIMRVVQAGLAERRRRLHQDNPVALLRQALANLETVAQQQQPTPSPVRFLQASSITVDIQKRIVIIRGEPVDLTPTEFDILIYLIRHHDRVISCREIATGIRGGDWDERDARTLLRSHIHRLRRKVERDPTQPRLIRTVRGSGYILAAEPAETDILPAS